MATRSGTPKFTIFRTAIRRRSCLSIPGTPALSHAVVHAFLKSCVSDTNPVERVDRPTKLRVPAVTLQHVVEASTACPARPKDAARRC
jgi:hypothetical protein